MSEIINTRIPRNYRSPLFTTNKQDANAKKLIGDQHQNTTTYNVKHKTSSY